MEEDRGLGCSGGNLVGGPNVRMSLKECKRLCLSTRACRIVKWLERPHGGCWYKRSCRDVKIEPEKARRLFCANKGKLSIFFLFGTSYFCTPKNLELVLIAVCPNAAESRLYVSIGLI
jgi:hypothetical protein